MSSVNTLRRRWSDSFDKFSEAKAAFDQALAFTATPAEKRAEIAKPGHLTEKGIAQALRASLAANVLPELRHHQRTLDDQAKALDAELAGLGEPKIDKSDVIGELRRQEVRTWLRNLSPSDRIAAVAATDDNQLMEAVLTARPEMTGLSAQYVETIRARYVQANHGAELEALSQKVEAVSLAGMALDQAKVAIREHVGLGIDAFNRWLETGEEPTREAA